MKHRNFQSLTLNPKGDQYVFSPYKINTLFSRQVMRIKKLSTKKISTKRCLVFLILSCSLTGNVTGNKKKAWIPNNMDGPLLLLWKLYVLHGILWTLPKVAYYPDYQYSIMKNGFTVPLLKYKHLNLKLRMLLADHTVSVVTYCLNKMLPTVKQWLDSFVYFKKVISTDKEWSKWSKIYVLNSVGTCFEPASVLYSLR